MSEKYELVKEIVKLNLIGINNLFGKLLFIINNFLKNNSIDFVKFLVERNVFQLGIGVLISSQLSILTSALTNVLISPITEKISGGKAKTVKDWTIDIIGMKFQLGLLLYTFINFIFILILIFYIWKIIDIKNYGFINDIVGIKK